MKTDPNDAADSPAPRGGRIGSDRTPTSSGLEALQGDRTNRIAQVEAALDDRYVIRRARATLGGLTRENTEYRFRGDSSRIAFTESTFRLATDSNSPSVARSMVELAQTRGWRTLRLSGSEEFKHMAWLEASLRGVRTLGYEPVPGELELPRKQLQARLINGGEPSPALTHGAGVAAPSDTPGGGGRKAVLAAIEAILMARSVSEPRRAAVMAAAAEQLTRRMRKGQSFQVRVYDKHAPSQGPGTPPLREPERHREPAGPMR